MEAIAEKKLKDILVRYDGNESELVTLLQETQREFGYLPREAMEAIARHLKLPTSTVYGVSTFYAQFKFTPAARRVIKVCRGTACHVRGNELILAEVEKQLGIKPGETTSDMKYSLETIPCFGSCALAPVVVVDKTVYGRMTPEKIADILR
ncbi:MAG: NADH-quinone oxidoreductase subunit NuoE [Chloroflexota bacterium]